VTIPVETLAPRTHDGRQLARLSSRAGFVDHGIAVAATQAKHGQKTEYFA
jgi:hypothetical protein